MGDNRSLKGNNRGGNLTIVEQLCAEISRDGFNFEPVLDGNYHKIKNPIRGRYVGSIRHTKDGIPYASMTVISWDDEYRKTYKLFDSTKVNGEADDLEREIHETHKKADEDKRRANELAASRADESFRVGRAWDESIKHPYLIRKHIDFDFGQRFTEDANFILIPCRDVEGKIWTVQRISCDGTKRFEKGSKKEGCFFQIGSGEANFIICEGVATGAALAKAGRSDLWTIICAMDAGNLRKVAKNIRNKNRSAAIFVFGDNDESGVGQKAAEAAAKEVGGHFLVPNKAGKDWNDVLIDFGPDVLKEHVEKFIKDCSSKIKFNDQFQIFNAAERRGRVELKPDWIVENIFARESISILSADPKAGKSTLTRFLTACIADGKSFLGFKCQASKVLMIAVEEKERFLLRDFEKLQITNWGNIFYHTATTPSEAVKKAEDEIIRVKPDFVILDTMFKILQPEDENSYAQTTKVISQLQNLASWHRCHILSVHHNNKGSGSGFSKILGSNGIRGAFDYNIVIDCDAKEIEKDSARAARFIMSEGREGHFFKKTALVFDSERKTFEVGESFEAYQKNKQIAETYGKLAQIKEAQTKEKWKKLLTGDQSDRQIELEKLIDGEYLIEHVEGKRTLWKWNRNKVESGAAF